MSRIIILSNLILVPYWSIYTPVTSRYVRQLWRHYTMNYWTEVPNKKLLAADDVTTSKRANITK